jgi:hypothetical protein
MMVPGRNETLSTERRGDATNGPEDEAEAAADSQQAAAAPQADAQAVEDSVILLVPLAA